MAQKYYLIEVMQMESLTLLNMDSHFELVSGAELETKDIVQIWPQVIYTNSAGYAVFLCEVENKRKRGLNNGYKL